MLRPLSQAHGAVGATAASTVAGAIPHLAFAGTLSAPRLAHLAPSVWGELAFLALGSTVAGMLLWNRAVLSGGATRVSLLLYLEPVVAVLGAVILLGEQVTVATIAGGLLILGGVAIASITRPAAPWRLARRRASHILARHRASDVPGAGRPVPAPATTPLAAPGTSHLMP